MRKRIKCVFHAESTPSLVLYRNFFKCYGCGKTGPLTELPEDLRPKEGEEYEDETKEDIKETFGYIESLRSISYRGLKFPADERGYYLCWPGGVYYKYRLFNPGKGSKYIGPKGHKPPIFWAKKTNSETLYLVEGEINALSLSYAITNSSVCSVGSASCFKPDILGRYLPDFQKYSNMIVVLDNDLAGTKALIESKAYFLYKVPFIKYILMDIDCNDLLQEKGPEGLREAVQRADSR